MDNIRVDGPKDCFSEGMERKKLWEKALKEFDALIKSPYEVKIETSKNTIEKAVKEFGDKIVVACSWGKDSIVVVHLAKEINPEIRVIFSNTGVEFPETYKYRDKMVKEWNLNYVELKPEKTFWEIVKEYGYPSIRYTGKQIKELREKGKNVWGGPPKCCKILKEEPAERYYVDNDIKAVLLGITHDESYTRHWVIIRWGSWYDKGKYVRIYPISYWNTEEVWRYIHDNNIPVNEAYEKYGIDRIGCMPCTGHIGWEEQLAKVNFKMYKKIASDMGKPPLETFTDQKEMGV